MCVCVCTLECLDLDRDSRTYDGIRSHPPLAQVPKACYESFVTVPENRLGLIIRIRDPAVVAMMNR